MASASRSNAAPIRIAALRRLDPLARDAFILAFVSRLVLFLGVWLSLRAIPRLPLYRDQAPDSLLPAHALLDGWTRWDAIHYVNIAAHGYPGGSGVAFFPAFPLMVRAAVTIVGVSPTTGHLAFAGIIIANLCFLAAVPLFARLAAGGCGDQAGRTAALLLCLTPFGFFFSAAYTESLFLLLVVATFALAGHRHWWLAGLTAGCASGTRLFGLALAPSLLLLAWKRGAHPRDLLAAALLSPSGAIAYGAYCGVALGDPLAPLHAQAGWGGWDIRLWNYAKLLLAHPHAALFGDPKDLSIVLNVAMAGLCLVALPWVWRLLDPGIALFTTLIAAQVVVAWVSLGRYLLPAIGVYIVGGALLARPGWSGWPRDAVVIGSALVLGGLAILFSHGYWIV